MSKLKKSVSEKKNVTHERLSGLPFNTAKAWKEAQAAVQMQVWRRLEEAKVIYELLKRDEYKFWKEEFKQGLVYRFGETGDTNLVRIYSEGNGISIAINRSLVDASPATESLLSSTLKSIAESFTDAYYRAKGMLPDLNEEEFLDMKQKVSSGLK